MITGIVRISYPHLFEPKANPSGVMKYSCCLLIPKDNADVVKGFKDEIASATARGKEKLWKGKVPKFRYQPLRDGDEELESGERTGAEYGGCYFINCSSDDPPGVANRQGRAVTDKGVVFAGCYVRADVRAFPYENSGNRGVGWGLNHILFWEDGPRLDGKQALVDAFKDFVEPESASAGAEDDRYDEAPF